jgi:ribulose-5-phosphate 4-epimerase/fuculose-1-phosphate aldolase
VRYDTRPQQEATNLTVPEIQISREIVAAAKRAEALGLVQNAQGNFSVRIPGKNCFMITPHGIPYAVIAPEDLVTVDLDGHILRGEHDSSSEADVHSLAYRRYHGVGACVHVEPTYLNTLYALNRPVPNILGNFVYLFGGRGLAACESLRSGTSGFASTSLDAMGDRFGVVWKNHGLFCVGDNLEVALDRCIAAEQAARVYYLALALQLGEPDMVPAEVQSEMVEVARASGWSEAV